MFLSLFIIILILYNLFHNYQETMINVDGIIYLHDQSNIDIQPLLKKCNIDVNIKKSYKNINDFVKQLIFDPNITSINNIKCLINTNTTINTMPLNKIGKKNFSIINNYLYHFSNNNINKFLLTNFDNKYNTLNSCFELVVFDEYINKIKENVDVILLFNKIILYKDKKIYDINYNEYTFIKKYDDYMLVDKNNKIFDIQNNIIDDFTNVNAIVELDKPINIYGYIEHETINMPDILTFFCYNDELYFISNNQIIPFKKNNNKLNEINELISKSDVLIKMVIPYYFLTNKTNIKIFIILDDGLYIDLDFIQIMNFKKTFGFDLYKYENLYTCNDYKALISKVPELNIKVC